LIQYFFCDGDDEYDDDGDNYDDEYDYDECLLGMGAKVAAALGAIRGIHYFDS
jgi:hypothetical protein